MIGELRRFQQGPHLICPAGYRRYFLRVKIDKDLGELGGFTGAKQILQNCALRPLAIQLHVDHVSGTDVVTKELSGFNELARFSHSGFRVRRCVSVYRPGQCAGMVDGRSTARIEQACMNHEQSSVHNCSNFVATSPNRFEAIDSLEPESWIQRRAHAVASETANIDEDTSQLRLG